MQARLGGSSMTSFLLCVFVLLLAFAAGRRTLPAGLIAVLGVGYVYGIVRANLLQPAAHFLFDAAVIGFYLALLFRRRETAEPSSSRELNVWLIALAVWPLTLFLLPLQDPLVQIVGLRGNIFLLPFAWLGAKLNERDQRSVGLGLAALNLAALAVAIGQFFLGIEVFLPRSPITELVYRSKDIAGGAYRLTSTFANAHAFGGTMVLSLVFLLPLMWGEGAKRLTSWGRLAIACGVIASMLGVFLAGARLPVVWLALLAITLVSSARLRSIQRAGCVLLLISLGCVVAQEARLQRFATLTDTDFLEERIGGSVNARFFDLLQDYPLGNGIGAGGTSIPHFLENRLESGPSMENEYARILLELGVPGLVLWAAFLLWILAKGFGKPSLSAQLRWTLCASVFVSGFLGLGLLTSIPGSCLLLIAAGQLATSRSIRKGWPRTQAIPEQAYA